ncbi:desiccation-related protein PCC13-62-like [Ipomoea triloba]|uniref:desiccation-related protein PCC13-62-like n=1 Tax=Ipomoea triloba TaxID=35885 RepID=UPI00125DB89C|nr:desiccation-related protein PCC13-62-like [Ipomoea triloba]
MLSIVFFLIITPSLGFATDDEHAGRDCLPECDKDLLEFALNLEYLEAEFFLWGAFGYGLDKHAPYLTGGGPAPIGVKEAKLCPLVKDIIGQFGLQEVGHVRAIKETVPGFPRPLLNLSAEVFAAGINEAFGKHLEPTFDPYANDINFLIACYIFPYIGLTGYVGANPKLDSYFAKMLVAGLLGVEAGQDAVLRAFLYERKDEEVKPYGITVAEFTNRISDRRNKLAGVKDEGLVVEPSQGPEGICSGNNLVGDGNSLAYDRTPEEILRIVYGTGKEYKPDALYPKGADGKIAKSYLVKTLSSE